MKRNTLILVIVDDHRRAVASQRDGRRAPDAGTRAGDDGDFSS